MTSFLAQLLDDESGATAIEYGLIAALIAVAIIAALISVGNEVVALLDYVADILNGANS